MTEMIERESAKIYAFPAGGRAGAKNNLGRHFEMTALEREVAALPKVNVAWDSWYHDAAIAEDDRLGQH